MMLLNIIRLFKSLSLNVVKHYMLTTTTSLLIENPLNLNFHVKGFQTEYTARDFVSQEASKQSFLW